MTGIDDDCDGLIDDEPESDDITPGIAALDECLASLDGPAQALVCEVWPSAPAGPQRSPEALAMWDEIAAGMAAIAASWRF